MQQCKHHIISLLFIGSVVTAQAAPLWHDADKTDLDSIALKTDTFVNVSKKVQPAVAFISTTQEVKQQGGFGEFGPGPEGMEPDMQDFFERFFRMPRRNQKQLQQGLGSGFIINEEGYIVTNNHVVERATEIKVTLVDDEEYSAKIIGRDENTDLALLKINAKHTFPFVKFGDSDRLRVGDVVVAVGNPFGLDHTVTQGIVSQKDRSIGFGRYDQFIQTDASINPGNSGGPLLNINGDVIGINAAIKGMNTGIGFAIPANVAKAVITQLKDKGKVTRGMIGVFIQKLTPSLRQALKLGSNKNGALVSSVVAGSPSEKAGILQRDVIIEFDGKEVKDDRTLPLLVAHTTVGKKVEVVVLRDGAKKSFDLVVEELREDNRKSGQGAPSLDKEDIGIAVQDLTPETAKKFGLERNEAGVVITDVEDNSLAQRQGLARGDIILEVNRKSIKAVSDYRTTMKGLKSGDTVLFLVKRGEGTIFIAFTL